MEKIKKFDKVETVLWAIVILFLINGILLGWYNTIAKDDWDFLHSLKVYGFLGTIKAYYYSWQGRISAYIITSATLLLNNYTNGLFVYYLFVVILFVASIYSLMNTISERNGIPIKQSLGWLLSIYFFIFFHEMVYDKSTLYWLAASASYYSGLAFALAGFAVLVSQSNLAVKTVLVFFLFLFAGCSVEHYGFIFLVLLIVALLTAFLFQKNNILVENRTGLFVATIACTLGIVIMMNSPGLEFRRAGFPKPDIISVLKIAANSIYHFYKFMFLPDLGKMILFASPFLYFGNKFANTEKKNNSLYLILIILFFILCIVLFSFLILAYGTGGMGQPRTQTHIAFILALGFSVVSFIVGYTLQISRQISLLLFLVSVVVWGMTYFQNLFRTVPESIKYSQSVTTRNALIESEKKSGRTESLLLDSLHFNEYVVYRSDEISNDTAGGWNKVIVRAMELDFKISSNATVISED